MVELQHADFAWQKNPNGDFSEMGGGAAQYLRAYGAGLSEDTALIVVKPTLEKGLLECEILIAGVCCKSVLIKSLSVLRSLRGVELLIVNSLVQWNEFLGEKVSVEAYTIIIDEVLALKRHFNAPLRFLLHDYFSVCPHFFLTDETEHYCNSEYDMRNCQTCNRTVDAAVWRKTMLRLLGAADEVRAFSDDTAQRIKRIYQGVNVRVVPHAAKTRFDKIPVLNRRGIVIGVFGGITRSKGLDEVLSLARYLLKNVAENVRVVMVGSISTNVSDLPNVRVRGSYLAKDLPQIVEEEKINLAFFSSVWPETFSYVTQELMALRLPIVCYNLGAPRDRVEKYPKGRIIPEMTAEATWNAISSLARAEGILV